jgi:hypothetical protein
MYYPYFRGKQYELIAIRESAKYFSGCNAVPIIEPVKESLSGLGKALAALVEEKAEFILIVNPKNGDMKSGATGALIEKIVNGQLKGYKNYSQGFIVDAKTDIGKAAAFVDGNRGNNLSIVHRDFTNVNDLKNLSEENENITAHVFIDGSVGKLYQGKFKREGVKRILIRDGFKKKKNADYPPDEHFSDLHVTFKDEGMDGFGDFLIVGDEYSETGGPAYAVAIHLTYLDSDSDMRIKHFISDRKDTPVDPAGKFLEALGKLKEAVDDGGSVIKKTESCQELLGLHERSHFPGLGYVKKLSMKHHIEILCDFCSS